MARDVPVMSACREAGTPGNRAGILKYRRKIAEYTALFCVIWLLAGCGRGPVSSSGLAESTAKRLAETDVSFCRADAFASGLCVVSGAESEPGEEVAAEAAGVFAADGSRIAVQRQLFERLYPASTTKVMTALLALEESSPDEMVTVGDEAVITEPGASLCHIQPGDTLTMEQLLYGLMLPSGNDAAAAIAVHLAGSEAAFAKRMNERARELGALGTHFLNPHGLHSEEHYTTAYDMYLIFREALKNDTFRTVIGTVSYTAQYQNAAGEEVSQTWENSNRYLTGECPMPEGLTVLGGKTGTTRAAGSCLVMASEDAAGKRWISVIMKSDSRDQLYNDMTSVLTASGAGTAGTAPVTVVNSP